jgi:antitoxin VapB
VQGREAARRALCIYLGIAYKMEIRRTRRAVRKKGRTLYISDAVIAALEEKLQRTDRPVDRTKLDALCARIGALPVLDARTPDEILGYDAFGIPG